jgi:NADH dehydrogenase/NADH:ubiquinone oxidoreductase subunit G
VPEQVELTIDGKRVSIAAGSTILQAAREVGIHIPTLCYFEHLTPNGVCRLCVVEVEGAPSLQAACVTAVRQGAVVHTRSPRVNSVRRTILELLASTVDLTHSPEIEGMLIDYRANAKRFSGGERRDPEMQDDNPVFIRDYAKCILCWRCVQVCGEDVQHDFAITLDGRGFQTGISTFSHRPLPETTCVFCGNCVGVCPTGALRAKREYLFEQGFSAEEAFRQTRLRGKGKRSRGGPRPEFA